MTRRVRHFALVLGLVAAAVSLTGTSIGSPSAPIRTPAELHSAVASTERMPANIVSTDRRDDTTNDRGIKLSRLVLLSVLVAIALLAVRRSYTQRVSQGQAGGVVVRSRHFGRSPPALVV